MSSHKKPTTASESCDTCCTECSQSWDCRAEKCFEGYAYSYDLQSSLFKTAFFLFYPDLFNLFIV